MKHLFGLMVMLLSISDGLKTCHEDGANVKICYGAMGGNVTLIDDFSAITRCEVKFNSGIIFRWIDNKIQTNNGNRFFVDSSVATFGMKNLNKSNSGEYKLEIYDKNGALIEERIFHLTVQAPVTSVQLVSTCLSQGEMHVSCSAENGDKPEYSWTLDGNPVKDDDLLNGSTTTNIIILKQNVEGRLVCLVKNNVSSVSKEEKIDSCGFELIDCIFNGTKISTWVHKENKTICGEPKTVSTSTTYIYVSTFVVLALAITGVAIFFYWRKRKNSRGEEEDMASLTYADLRIGQKKRSVEQKMDEEVKYSEVKFSEDPRLTVSTTEECVYAEIRKTK